jgi:hypothetical protein
VTDPHPREAKRMIVVANLLKLKLIYDASCLTKNVGRSAVVFVGIMEFAIQVCIASRLTMKTDAGREQS